MRESIFYASMKSFFVGLCGIMGFLLGICLIIILISTLSSETSGEPDINYLYSVEVAPNAEGVRKVLSKDTPVILKINIKGIIGTESLSRKTIESLLVESRERSLNDGRVKAILLDIDTPGGTATDAYGIYQAIKTYKQTYQLPVYAYVNGLCASGGMYVACAADKIFASNDSLIGSVGVIAPSFLNFSQLMEKVGVQSLTLSAGKGKDDMNPLRPWRAGEEDNYKSIISYYYGQFVDAVTTNRPQLNKEKLVDDYGANIFPATLAEEYGYVDSTGQSYSDVLKQLAEAMGIHDDKYQVVQMENKNWLSELFKGQAGMFSGVVKHKLELSEDLNPQFLNQYLYLYRP